MKKLDNYGTLTIGDGSTIEVDLVEYGGTAQISIFKYSPERRGCIVLPKEAIDDLIEILQSI